MIALMCLCRESDVVRCKTWPELDDGIEPRIVALGRGLAAVAADVPAEMFVGPAAEERLQDAAWLRDRAVAHQAIVEGASRCGAVFPVPFGRVFNSLESLRDRITPCAEVVVDFLDRIAGLNEYSVRVLVDREQIAEIVAEQECSSGASESPGQRYLARARLKRNRGDGLAHHMESLRERAMRQLGDFVVEFVERPILQHRDDQQQVIVNAAVLVERSCDVHALLDPIAGSLAHASIEVSGPWPAYSFTPRLDRVGGTVAEVAG